MISEKFISWTYLIILSAWNKDEIWFQRLASFCKTQTSLNDWVIRFFFSILSSSHNKWNAKDESIHVEISCIIFFQSGLRVSFQSQYCVALWSVFGFAVHSAALSPTCVWSTDYGQTKANFLILCIPNSLYQNGCW